MSLLWILLDDQAPLDVLIELTYEVWSICSSLTGLVSLVSSDLIISNEQPTPSGVNRTWMSESNVYPMIRYIHIGGGGGPSHSQLVRRPTWRLCSHNLLV